MNIILFDGVCNLCNGVVAFVIKRDKKALFRFAALQSRAGQTLLKHYVADAAGFVTLYYLRDGHCLQKSTAVLYILKDLGGICQCFFPLIYLPACLRDAVYLFISRHRYRWFGKKRSCMLPAPDIRERFIG